MSLYDKINGNLAPLQQKLFDVHVKQNGRTLFATRLSIDQDAWGNGEPSVLTESNIEAIVVFPPGELPLHRMRADAQEGVQSTSLFFYDILPIEAYFPLAQKIEDGDVIYFSIFDEVKNKIPIMFKVLSSTGAVSTHLLRRKYICAPLTSLSEVPEAIAIEITNTLLTPEVTP